jgi:Amt family ammonium transporter
MASSLQAQISALQREVELLRNATESQAHASAVSHLAIDTLWALWAAFTVFFMQARASCPWVPLGPGKAPPPPPCLPRALTVRSRHWCQAGFGMLEVGCVRKKNTKHILMKNMIDTSVAGLMWWLIGATLAGEGGGPFIGSPRPGASVLDAYSERPGSFPLTYMYAATASTIVSGAIAERTQQPAYMLSSTFMSGLIFPVVAHWFWSSDGWLSISNPDAFLGGSYDFAGGCVVHVSGGVLALLAAAIIKPRDGRFNVTTGKPEPIPGQSSLHFVLGTFLLWFGWLGFNVGSLASVDTDGAPGLAVQVVSRTVISGCSGALFSLFLARWRSGHWNVSALCNGILAGLVSITAGCAFVPTWASVLIGALGGLLYSASSYAVLHWLEIDDAVDAFAVHAVCGLWGMIAVPIFTTAEFVGHHPAGPFNQGYMLAAALVGSIAITAWVTVTGGVVFFLLSIAKMLRVPVDVEVLGIDELELGGTAYGHDPMEAPTGPPRRPPPYAPALAALPAQSAGAAPGGEESSSEFSAPSAAVAAS